MKDDKTILLIARTLASAGLNVSVPAVKIILATIELVDEKGEDITLKEISDMANAAAMEDLEESVTDPDADDK